MRGYGEPLTYQIRVKTIKSEFNEKKTFGNNNTNSLLEIQYEEGLTDLNCRGVLQIWT